MSSINPTESKQEPKRADWKLLAKFLPHLFLGIAWSYACTALCIDTQGGEMTILEYRGSPEGCKVYSFQSSIGRTRNWGWLGVALPYGLQEVTAQTSSGKAVGEITVTDRETYLHIDCERLVVSDYN